MARVAAVPASDAGWMVKLAYRFGPRMMKRLTGRVPEHGLEPMGLFAHIPKVMMAYFRLDQRLGDLAQLKAATMTHCEYCIDMGSQIGRHRSGVSDEQLLALPRYRQSTLFTEVEKLVLDYAVAVSRTPVEVSDALSARLREHFDDAQIVELTHLIALENYRGRFNFELGAGAAGFSEGLVCAPQSDRSRDDINTTSRPPAAA
jgi:AhpD family alkylhydroperoxidase